MCIRDRGIYIFFCGDFNQKENCYNNIFQTTEQAYQNALNAELKWLASEVEE